MYLPCNLRANRELNSFFHLFSKKTKKYIHLELGDRTQFKLDAWRMANSDVACGTSRAHAENFQFAVLTSYP